MKMKKNKNQTTDNHPNLRAIAAKVLYDVAENGYSLADCLPTASAQLSDPRDKALLQALCYGACRWFFRLDAIALKLLDKPLKQKDNDIYALILIGLYQLMDMRIPDYAAVTETVDASLYFKKPWAKGLINGVLRQYQRHMDELNENLPLRGIYAHPDWMIGKIKKHYPSDLENILDANNQHPPFSLRVNQKRIQRDDYLKLLSDQGISAQCISETHAGIILEEAIDVLQLPGFSDGDISVQDGAAQLAAELLELAPGQHVLDACAAPGGKTAHMLELQPDISCVAVDHDAERLISVKENLQRLQLSATCITADVAKTEKWWDGKLFDRILLDAPCSASGVIRRHPDIKLLRRPTDIAELASIQLELLNAVWPLLKPNGLLVYATCSIFVEENTHVLKQFLTLHPEAKEEKIAATWGIDCEIGKQILPGMHDMDGFYFARLRK